MPTSEGSESKNISNCSKESPLAHRNGEGTGGVVRTAGTVVVTEFEGFNDCAAGVGIPIGIKVLEPFSTGDLLGCLGISVFVGTGCTDGTVVTGEGEVAADKGLSVAEESVCPRSANFVPTYDVPTLEAITTIKNTHIIMTNCCTVIKPGCISSLSVFCDRCSLLSPGKPVERG
jgi:hypothetical protein